MSNTMFDLQDPESVEAEVNALFKHGVGRGLNARQMSLTCALALAHMAQDCTDGYEDRRETVEALASMIRRHAGVAH